MLSDLWDNALLLGAVALDVSDPATYLSGGDTPRTAAVAEAQNAEREGRAPSAKRAEDSAKGGLKTLGKAATDTAGQVADKAASAAKWLDRWGLWVAGGAALVVAAVALAPYLGAAGAAVKAVTK